MPRLCLIPVGADSLSSLARVGGVLAHLYRREQRRVLFSKCGLLPYAVPAVPSLTSSLAQESPNRRRSELQGYNT